MILALGFSRFYQVRVLSPLRAFPIGLRMIGFAFDISWLMNVGAIAIRLPVANEYTDIKVRLNRHTHNFQRIKRRIRATQIIIGINTQVEFRNISRIQRFSHITSRRNQRVITSRIPITIDNMRLDNGATQIARNFQKIITVRRHQRARRRQNTLTNNRRFNFNRVTRVINRHRNTINTNTTDIRRTLKGTLTIGTLRFLSRLRILRRRQTDNTNNLQILIVTSNNAIVTNRNNYAREGQRRTNTRGTRNTTVKGDPRTGKGLR